MHFLCNDAVPPQHPSAKWIFFQGFCMNTKQINRKYAESKWEDKSMLTVAWVMLLFNTYLNNYISLHCNIQTPTFSKSNLFFFQSSLIYQFLVVKEDIDILERKRKYSRNYIIFPSHIRCYLFEFFITVPFHTVCVPLQLICCCTNFLLSKLHFYFQFFSLVISLWC